MNPARLSQLSTRASENIVGVAMANYPSDPSLDRQGWGQSCAFDLVFFDENGRYQDRTLRMLGEKEDVYKRQSLECSVAENNALFSYSVSVNEQKNLMVVLSCPLDSNGIPSGELSVQKWQVETLANDTLPEEPVLNLASQPPLLH